jgi:hypothetical protein
MAESHAPPAADEILYDNLFARPDPLVPVALPENPVNVSELGHVQRYNEGRFYNSSSTLATDLAASTRANRLRAVNMMETILGKEYHGDDRCEECSKRDNPCVVYTSEASRYIRNPGSA